jgi:hypothetical protein
MSTRWSGSWLGALALGACGCRPPTEVTLEITTNVNCLELQGTAIIVGTPDDIETKDPATQTESCSDGNIGSIVLVPGADRTKPFAIKVVTGVNVLAEDCVQDPMPAGSKPGKAGCIVSRRVLGFVPHTPLIVPILLRQSCLGVVCPAGETCTEEGACIPDEVLDPNRCAEPGGCDDTSLGSGGAGGAGSTTSSGSTGGAQPDGGTDGGAEAGP